MRQTTGLAASARARSRAPASSRATRRPRAPSCGAQRSSSHSARVRASTDAANPSSRSKLPRSGSTAAAGHVVRRAQRRAEQREALAGGARRHDERSVELGRRRDAHRDLRQHRERAPRAREQLRQVVARDVLDDLAAGFERLAAARDGVKAQEVIARRAGRHAPRAREVGREHAADRLRRVPAPSSAPKSGGSNASRCACVASARSIAASGVAARAVSTSSAGS